MVLVYNIIYKNETKPKDFGHLYGIFKDLQNLRHNRENRLHSVRVLNDTLTGTQKTSTVQDSSLLSPLTKQIRQNI